MVPGPPGPHATGIPHPAIVNPQIKHEPPHETDIMHMWVLQAQKFSLGHTLHSPAVGALFLFSRLEQIISEGMCSSDNIPMPRLASGLTTLTAHTGLTLVRGSIRGECAGNCWQDSEVLVADISIIHAHPQLGLHSYQKGCQKVSPQ